jgi:hypothetical protein
MRANCDGRDDQFKFIDQSTSSTIGAQLEYTYPNYKDIVSYVPGCGITDLKNPTNGAEFTLTSIGSYSSIGSLARRAATATYLDTAASLLGQRRNKMPGAFALQPSTCLHLFLVHQQAAVCQVRAYRSHATSR